MNVRAFGSKRYAVHLTTTATVGDLFSCIRKKCNLGSLPIRLECAGSLLSEHDYHKTLEDAGIYHKMYVHVLGFYNGGGGYMVESFSSCDECLSKYSCQFTTSELCNPVAIQKLIDINNNAYLIFCQRFNFSNEVIRAIEDNTESNGVRLTDALHRIYHKDPSITLEQVNTYDCCLNHCMYYNVVAM